MQCACFAFVPLESIGTIHFSIDTSVFLNETEGVEPKKESESDTHDAFELIGTSTGPQFIV